MLTVKITKPNRVNPVFMHPAIFIPSWVILGALFALQELLNLRRWGYDIGTGIEFVRVNWGRPGDHQALFRVDVSANFPVEDLGHYVYAIVYTTPIAPVHPADKPWLSDAAQTVPDL